MINQLKILSIFVMGSFALAIPGLAAEAFKINGKSVSVEKLYQENQDKFYELEKQKYELIERMAQQQFLDSYWDNLGKSQGTSSEKARDKYIASKAKVSDKDLNEAIGKFKDHPQLKELSEAEKKKQIGEYLKSVKTREIIDEILQNGIKDGKLVVTYPRPKEPIYNVTVTKNDPVKYGPKPSDVKPMGCEGDACAITVVEYSEFQCPFCTKVLPTVDRLMTEYKGKVRWIVRDFPLGFHKRARPAAAAAHCAKDQGKFWEMYEELFRNQRKLEDADLQNHAKTVKLDMKKFNKCLKDPKTLAKVESNFRSGEALGVTGTPAFFINGRRLSGALPYGEFKKIFDEELKASNKG
ncbi:MAG: thioredoxin domain-containing protein [Pseudobacteriovorax sp.]|nr:thioredoxin domain-containing protein [Pseudobacteriovorax sp.]